MDFCEFDQQGWKQFQVENWSKKKSQYLSHLRMCWGKFPPFDQFDSVFMGKIEKEGYSIEKYNLMVSATGHSLDDLIPIWLLIPNDSNTLYKSKNPNHPSFPAIIIHQSEMIPQNEGKEEFFEIDNREFFVYAEKFVRKGIIVAFFDALGFGERIEEGGLQFTADRLLLYGMTLNGKYCFDIARIFEFLRLRKDVVEDRIGIMGDGLGGLMAIWGAIFEPRFKLILSSNGIGRMGGMNSILSDHLSVNPAYFLPNLLDPKIGMDMHEIVGFIYPRSLFLANNNVSTPLSGEGVAEIHKWVEDLYHSFMDNIESDEKSISLTTFRCSNIELQLSRLKDVFYDFVITHL